MLSLYKRINNIIWWHAGESIIYHGILLIHQSLLFTTAPSSIYGLIGSLFSALYLTVNIINAGLDTTLSSLFTTYAKSKKLVWKFIGIQLLINYGISIAVIIALYIFWYSSISSATIPLTIILLLILLENIKKIIKTLLQLTFQLKVTVLGELGTIVSYLCLVWGAYVAGFPINVYLIFIPLLFVRLIETTIFFSYIYRWYQTLPSDLQQPITRNDYKRIIKIRTSTFLNQLHHSCFSGNFLVLLTAHLFGFDYAGIIKFSSSIAFNITVMVKKIFGTSNNILSAAIKNKSITIQQNLFSLITNKMYHFLFCLSLFFVINYKFLLHATDTSQNIVIYLSFLIIFIENFFTTYEQFYIMREKTSYLLFINGLTIFLLYGIYAYKILFSLPLLLLTIFLIRLFSLMLTSMLSFFLWRLKPLGTIRPLYIISSLVISLLVWFAYN